MSESVDKSKTPVLDDENQLKLGIFGINMRGGVTLSPIDEMVQGTWEENLRYAKWADRIGIDAMGVLSASTTISPRSVPASDACHCSR